MLKDSSENIIQSMAGLNHMPNSTASDIENYINKVEKFLLQNEKGDADIFIKKLKNNVAICRQTNDEYIFNNHYWRKDSNNSIIEKVDIVVKEYEKIIEIVNHYKCLSYANGDSRTAEVCEKLQVRLEKRISSINTVSRRKNIIEMASSGEHSLAVDIKKFDTNPMLLCCQNGVIDLETGQLRDGKPDDYITIAAPTYWEGLEKECPVWKKFMLEVFDNDQEIVSFMQRLFGYGLTGLTTEHIFPILVGKGRNGKSTALETISNILGEFATPFSHELLHELNHSRSSAAPSPDIMAIRGRRLTWCSETEENKRLNAAKIKRLTGGDKLTARALYGKDVISFDPTHKIMLLCNNIPTIDVDDYAFNQRLAIIKYPFSFVDNPIEDFERKKDGLLKDKLMKESSGILAWLVRGCLEFQKNGLCIPSKIRVDTDKHLNDENIILKFTSEVCNINPDYRVQASVIYSYYKEWAIQNGFKPLNITNFGKRLSKIHERKTFNGKNCYLGLAAKPEFDHLVKPSD